MMKSSSAATCLPQAGKCPLAVVVFGVVVLVTLGSDLALKHFSFKWVADQPVYLNLDQPGAIPVHDSIVVVRGLLNLHLTANTGAVFGLGKGAKWVFVVVSVVAIAVIMRLFWRSRSNAWILHVALALILAGALGNLYDRVMYSAVRDMLHLFPGAKLPIGLHWPGNGHSDELYPWLFNLADAALMVGVGLVLMMGLLSKPQRQPKPQSDHD
jgi:signal peptidase II